MFAFKGKYFWLFNVKRVLRAISLKANPQKHWILNASVKEHGDVFQREEERSEMGTFDYPYYIYFFLYRSTVLRDSTSFPGGYGVGVEEGKKTDVSVLHNLPFVIQNYATISPFLSSSFFSLSLFLSFPLLLTHI